MHGDTRAVNGPRRARRNDASGVQQPGSECLLEGEASIELEGASSSSIRRERSQIGRVWRFAAGEGDASQKGDTRHEPGGAGEREIAANVEIDVTEPAAKFGETLSRATRFCERHQNRDLPALEHTNGAKQVLLEIELGRAGRRP